MELFYGFLYILIGILSGFFVGIIGVGAGLITIPALIYAGCTIKQAVAVSLIIQMIPQTIPAVYLNYSNNIIKKSIIYITILILCGSIIGTTIGAYINTKHLISNQTMYRTLSLFLFVSSVFIGYKYWNITKV